MAALLAGLPDSVPGVTVNRLCASACLRAAEAAVVAEGDLFVAGGVESMSPRPPSWRAGSRLPPRRSARVRHDSRLAFSEPKLEELFPLESMGETARTWPSVTASRQEQDAFALESQRRWGGPADAEGRFADQLVPVGE